MSPVFSQSCRYVLFPFFCVCVSLQSVFLFSFSFFLFYFGIPCSLCLISYYSVQLCSHLSPLSNTDVLRLHWVFCDFFCCWCAKSFIRCVLAANLFKVVRLWNLWKYVYFCTVYSWHAVCSSFAQTYKHLYFSHPYWWIT